MSQRTTGRTQGGGGERWGIDLKRFDDSQSQPWELPQKVPLCHVTHSSPHYCCHFAPTASAPQQRLRSSSFFFSFSFPLTIPFLSIGALGHPLSLANASGGSPFISNLLPLCPLPGLHFLFLFSADPSPSLTGAQGPHLLANASGGYPLSQICTCRALLLTNVKRDSAASWFIFFLLLLFHLLTTSFPWNPPPAHPFVMDRPCHVAYTPLVASLVTHVRFLLTTGT